MVSLKLWMELGMNIEKKQAVRFLEEVVLEMLQILWVGICINLTNVMVSPKSDVYNQYLAYHEGHAGFRRGSYKKKKWLIKIAKSVQKRAINYSAQLARCT